MKKKTGTEKAGISDKGFSHEVIERLKEVVKSAGGNKALSDKSGIPLSTLNDALAGNSDMGAKRLAALAAAAGRSLDWIMYGDEESRALAAVNRFLDGEGGIDFVPVRRLGFRASAGNGQLVVETESVVPFSRAILDRLGVKPENARLMEAAGDSMRPTINDGDLTVVDVSSRDVIDGKVFVFTIGDEAFVKRLRRAPGRRVLMISDNRDVFPEPEEVPHSEPFSIIGQLKWVERQL